MKVFFLLLFITYSSWAKIESEFSGNAEIQARHAWNNSEARKDFFQNWDEEDFYLGYGNLNAKFESGRSKLDSNIFLRHSRSDLYQNNYLATQFFNFPQNLVARDLFKLQHTHQNKSTRDEVILNKFHYQWENEKGRLSVGRLYINYGLGEIFNPINPFNQPTGLTSISQVAQGNDGAGYTYFIKDDHRIEFYVLGDKRFHNYEGEIEETLWLHGELQVSPSLALDYVLGKDQNLDKFGFQLGNQFGDNLVFLQTLYQSNSLLDILIGYDRQLNSKWHLRAESGYQKLNRNSTFLSSERFLPTEYFIALANTYEIHPLLKSSFTLINDIKSNFTYGILKLTYSVSENAEGEIFAYSPLIKGKEADYIFQKLVTQDIGLSLRYFF